MARLYTIWHIHNHRIELIERISLAYYSSFRVQSILFPCLPRCSKFVRFVDKLFRVFRAFRGYSIPNSYHLIKRIKQISVSSMFIHKFVPFGDKPFRVFRCYS